jgi:hypothetical protein
MERISMQRPLGILATLALFVAASHLHADVWVQNKGAWPKSWPRQLDRFRVNSRTIEGPLGGYLRYEIPIADRDAFEAAWPHFLKVRSASYPIVLIRSPYTGKGAAEGNSITAGVIVNTFPAPQIASATAEEGRAARVESATVIVLVVDGEIVDLNRISLPEKTQIKDERFKDRGSSKL